MAKEYIRESRDLVKKLKEKDFRIPQELLKIQELLEECDGNSEKLVNMMESTRQGNSLNTSTACELFKKQDRQLNEVSDSYRKLMEEMNTDP